VQGGEEGELRDGPEKEKGKTTDEREREKDSPK
jgi:hypothetical protein